MSRVGVGRPSRHLTNMVKPEAVALAGAVAVGAAAYYAARFLFSRRSAASYANKPNNDSKLAVRRVKMSPAGPTVSELVVGLMRFTTWGAKYSPEQTLNVVKECIAMGITTFDCAAIYGGGDLKHDQEANLGAALALAPGLRETIEIVTKCGIIMRPGAAHSNYYDSSADAIVESVNKSLAALQTSFIDVLLIHRPDLLMDADEVAAAFTQLRSTGKVRFFGVSNFSAAQVTLLTSRLPADMPLVTNQLELSLSHTKLLSYPYGDGTLDVCQQLRARPMAWSPLGPIGGPKLVGSEPKSDKEKKIRAAVREVANELCLPDADGDAAATAVAIGWVAKHPSQPLIITGSTKLERIVQAVDGLAVARRMSRLQWYRLLEASVGYAVP